jgi:hypothetical protein
VIDAVKGDEKMRDIQEWNTPQETIDRLITDCQDAESALAAMTTERDARDKVIAGWIDSGSKLISERDALAAQLRTARQEQKEKDVKIAKKNEPSGEIVTSWGMQETVPCVCGEQIAAKIRAQPDDASGR